MVVMTDAFFLCFELAVNLFQSFMFMVFIDNFGEKRFDEKRDRIILVAAALVHFIVLSLLNYTFESHGNIEPVVLLSIYLAYSFICSKAKILSRIFAALITIGTTYICSALIGFLVSFLSKKSLGDLMSISSVYRIACVITINVVLFWAFKLIIKFKHKNFNLLKWTDWAMFIIIPLLTLLIVAFCYSIALESTLTTLQTVYLLLISLGVFILCVITYFMIVRISRDSEINLNYTMLKNRYNEQLRNIEQMKQNNERISVLRHDMKNKLSCMGELIESGKYEKALQFCNTCLDETQKTSLSIDCGNHIINAIINAKSIICSERNISFNVAIFDALANIDDVDVCVVLSNLLDNAIEAVSNLDGEKNIRCEIAKKREYYTITISNSIAASVLENNPNLRTTKNDKEIHGLGIKSVRAVAEKYDGDVHFYEKSDRFFCNILLKPTNCT